MRMIIQGIHRSIRVLAQGLSWFQQKGLMAEEVLTGCACPGIWSNGGNFICFQIQQKWK